MFPLNDTEPNRYSEFPFMTLSIIGMNVLVMLAVLALTLENPFHLLMIFFRFGSIPQLVLSRQGGGPLTSITALFLHGGFFHLIGNMYALWVFGRRIEDACGPWRFLAFYLLCGLCADVTNTIINPHVMKPSIGASGAIFGIMGAYILLFPDGRIRTLLILGFLPTWPRIRAGWVILYTLVLQLIPALNILLHESQYQIAYWAHLGGFLSCVFVLFFLRPQAFARYLSDAPV